MTKIALKGWSPGFRSISFIHALQAHCKYDLANSKSCVDRVLAGEIVVVEAASDVDAAQLLHKAELLGAKAEVSRGEKGT